MENSAMFSFLTTKICHFSASGRGAAAFLQSHWPNRDTRVMIALIIVVVLSGVDLALTLHYLTGGGLLEDNPIAAALVLATGSVSAVVLLKGVSVGVAASILHHLRWRAAAELGAWLAVIILTGLTIQWAQYAHCVAGLDKESL